MHDLEFEGHLNRTRSKNSFPFRPVQSSKNLKKIISLPQKIFEIEMISGVGVKIYPHIPLTS